VGTRFSARSDRPWGPPSLLYNRYRVFPGGKVRPGRAADHWPPSSAAVMEEYSYTSTHPLGQTGPVTGSLYLYLFLFFSPQLWFQLHYNIVTSLIKLWIEGKDVFPFEHSEEYIYIQGVSRL